MIIQVDILLVVYDNESYVHHFPQGLAYIAAVLENNGHAVTIYNQDKHHYQDDHLTRYLDNNIFDAVGVGIIAGYYQYRKLLNISEAINKSRNRPFYMIGGHGPSPEPEYFLKKTGADAVVIGEGEETVVELMEAVSGGNAYGNIKGIVYRDGQSIIKNEKRLTIKDVDSIPFPAYHLFPIDYYRLLRAPHAANTDFVMSVLSGRGCKFHCSFCYRMDEGFRPRRNDSIIEEIRFLQKVYGITYVVFSDELLMSSVDRAMSLCEDLLREEISIKWCCNGRLNYAKPEVLKIMKRAGCVFINYGIEAMDDTVLMNMNKALTTEIILEGIGKTLNAGISPGYNIIFGNIGDDKETLAKAVDFLIRYDDGAQMRTIRPVTPYPGSPLYYHAIKNGLIKDCEDFYAKHVNSDLVSVNFTDFTDEEFHACLLDANIKLITSYYNKKLGYAIEKSKNLYFDKNANFRGYRQA